MIYPMVIKLPLFDLRYSKIKDGIDHRIELHADHLIWIIHCYLDELPKQEEGEFETKENQYYCNTDFIMKNKIGSVESYFDNKYELWVLQVTFGSRETDCKFETESEMRQIEQLLHSWMADR